MTKDQINMMKVSVRTSPTRILLWVLGVIIIVGIPECKHDSDKPHPADSHVARDVACRSMDRTSLDSVIRCFYAPATSSEQRWQLLSTKSQRELPDGLLRRSCDYVEATLLGQQQNREGTYARIGVRRKCYSKDGSFCTRYDTNTWISEKTEWRRISVNKIRNLAAKKFNDGDYSSAEVAAKEWLAIDPFSEDAYKLQLGSMVRSMKIPTGFLTQWGSGTIFRIAEARGNILRALLSINPLGSTALLAAISYTDNIDVQKEFLSRLSKDDCNYATAVFNMALNIRRAKERLSFITSHPSIGDAPDLLILRIDALSTLRQHEAIRELLNDATTHRILADLANQDSGYGAIWAIKTGQAALSADLDDIAKRFLDYAMNCDPTNKGIQTLVKAIRKKTEKKAAQSLIVKQEAPTTAKELTVSRKNAQEKRLRTRVNALLKNSQDENTGDNPNSEDENAGNTGGDEE